MTIFAYMLCGLFVGVIARLVLPQTRVVGLWGSAILGAVGGLVGGLVGAAIAPRELISQVHPLGVVLAVGMSAVVSGGIILVSRHRPTA